MYLDEIHVRNPKLIMRYSRMIRLVSRETAQSKKPRWPISLYNLPQNAIRPVRFVNVDPASALA